MPFSGEGGGSANENYFKLQTPIAPPSPYSLYPLSPPLALSWQRELQIMPRHSSLFVRLKIKHNLATLHGSSSSSSDNLENSYLKTLKIGNMLKFCAAAALCDLLLRFATFDSTLKCLGKIISTNLHKFFQTFHNNNTKKSNSNGNGNGNGNFCNVKSQSCCT